ncbi:Helix-turn-helix domain-containing protein [Methylorubrum thiocyanatum]
MQPHAEYRVVVDGRSSHPAEVASGRCLIPFDRREGISVEAAAEIAGKSVRTLRLWCEQHQIGRRVGGGPWVVSRPALEMLLNDDQRALSAYLSGDRESPLVTGYFERVGLQHLPAKWGRHVAAIAATATYP